MPTVGTSWPLYVNRMKNYRKILYPLTALLLAIVLAACAGARTAESFEVVGPEPEYESGTIVIAVGESVQLGGRVTFDNGTVDGVAGAIIAWSIDDQDYVTVDNVGRVTGVEVTGPLTSSVTVTGTHDGMNDTIDVRVEPAD